MDFDELRLFQHLARTLHFGVASRECHVSPSTLTRTIQRLEEEVAAPLFTRSKRRVELTDGGRTLARYAAEALPEFDALRASLRQAGPASRGGSGCLRP